MKTDNIKKGTLVKWKEDGTKGTVVRITNETRFADRVNKAKVFIKWEDCDNAVETDVDVVLNDVEILTN